MTAKLTPSAALGGTTVTPAALVSNKTSLADRNAAMSKHAENKPPHSACADCQQEPWISIFFDGTGNNLDADKPKRKQSNVVRLHDAHKVDKAKSIVPIYIAGIGTYNKDISDTYDGLLGMAGMLGNALASRGEARLKEAMEKYDKVIESAVARATNPVNKILKIHLALFGFSRGAALARAFAVRMQKLCEPDGHGGMRTKQGHYPIEIYFMGLFDTVASVGAPPAAKNWLRDLRELYQTPLNKLIPLSVIPITVAQAALVSAADVFLSAADGHVAWGADMTIPAPSMVKHCEHMVAAHEWRNSFPLDSVLDNGLYPGNCRESVYPGAHSDVGGGYRPSEGGKCDTEGELLSQIPLREMHKIALVHGVPMFKLEDKGMGQALRGFVLDDTLAKRYNHYMQTVGYGGKPLSDMYLSHMSLYYRWRIIHVGRVLLAEKTKTQTDEEKKLSALDTRINIEKAQKEKEVELARKALEQAKQACREAVWAMAPSEKYKRETLGVQRKREDEYYAKHQELDQLPSTGKLAKNLRKYDKEFLDDSQKILRADPKKLSRYQRMIFDAWNASALNDPELIAFFDLYVHDSHAGFGVDMTHAIDPRILYQGGDRRIELSQTENEQAMQQVA
jgi:hypothetical protein